MATYDLGGVVRRAQQMNGVQQGMLLVGVLGSALLLASMGRPDVQEVSFQHFRTHLLANGVVDHIEVSNKAAAKVFVRPGSQRCAARARTALSLCRSVSEVVPFASKCGRCPALPVASESGWSTALLQQETCGAVHYVFARVA